MQETTARFLRYLKIERNSSDYTIKSYREDLEILIEYFQDTLGRIPTPGELTPQDLRTYVAALHQAGYAKTSVARRLASLRSFFRFAQREGLCDSNPAKPLRNPRRERKLPHFLTTAEVGKLLLAPDTSDPMGNRDRAIFETLYSAGLRVSELVGINLNDLDLEDGLVRVRGKGKRERLAPLGSFAVKSIHQWMANRAPADKQRSRRRWRPFVSQQVWPETYHTQHRPHAGKVSKADWIRFENFAPHNSPQFRDALCSTAAPTFAAYKNYWDINLWSPPKSTPTSAPPVSVKPTNKPIPRARRSGS